MLSNRYPWVTTPDERYLPTPFTSPELAVAEIKKAHIGAGRELVLDKAFPQLIANELASIQAGATKQFYLSSSKVEESNVIRIQLASCVPDYQVANGQIPWDYSTDAGVETTAKHLAIHQNHILLNKLVDSASAVNYTFGTRPPQDFDGVWLEYLWCYVQACDNHIFAENNGPATHIVAGDMAILALVKAGFKVEPQVPNALYYGCNDLGTVTTPAGSKLHVLSTHLFKNPNKILITRHGSEWMDAPIVWSPKGLDEDAWLVLPQKSATIEVTESTGAVLF